MTLALPLEARECRRRLMSTEPLLLLAALVHVYALHFLSIGQQPCRFHFQ